MKLADRSDNKINFCRSRPQPDNLIGFSLDRDLWAVLRGRGCGRESGSKGR